MESRKNNIQCVRVCIHAARGNLTLESSHPEAAETVSGPVDEVLKVTAEHLALHRDLTAAERASDGRRVVRRRRRRRRTDVLHRVLDEELRALVQLLALHPAVLEPDLDLTLGEVETRRDLPALLTGDVGRRDELVLEDHVLVPRVRLALLPLLRLVYEVHRCWKIYVGEYKVESTHQIQFSSSILNEQWNMDDFLPQLNLHFTTFLFVIDRFFDSSTFRKIPKTQVF